jgi:type II secretory pathway predicted ATPase ExeA/tetratricopeptide (TPR) repeat protein
MYTTYFGLRQPPFHVTADPQFLYFTPTSRIAYTNLLDGIRQRAGLMLLTGEVGTGKTVLLRHLFNELTGMIQSVFPPYPIQTFAELLSFLSAEFGLDINEASPRSKLQVLHDFLSARYEEGRTEVLLLDEAHDVADDILASLPELAGLGRTNEKLLQIILVGQRGFEQKLAGHTLRPLAQHIAVRCRLNRLPEHEVEMLIRHRLRIAGCEHMDLFSPAAIRRVAVYSQGLPRLINLLCDAALLLTYKRGQQTVPAEIIESIAEDLELTARSEVVRSATDLRETLANPIDQPQQGNETSWDLGQGDTSLMNLPAAVSNPAEHRLQAPVDIVKEGPPADKQELATSTTSPFSILTSYPSRLRFGRLRWREGSLLAFLLVLSGVGAVLYSQDRVALSPGDQVQKNGNSEEHSLPVSDSDQSVPSVGSNMPEAHEQAAVQRGNEAAREEARQRERVAALLARAEGQMAARRLTTPPGDNALATYQQILKDAPQFAEEALTGMRKVAAYYRRWAEGAQHKAQWAKAQTYYQQALNITPQDEMLLTSLREVQRRAQDEQTEEQPPVEELQGRAAAHVQLARFGIPYEREEFVQSAADGDSQAVAVFLTAGMSPNVKDEEGWPALLRAAQQGHLAVVQELLAHNAAVNATNPQGQTALMDAVRNDHFAIVQELLAHGAAVNVKDMEGQSALSYVEERGADIPERKNQRLIRNLLTQAGAQ